MNSHEINIKEVVEMFSNVKLKKVSENYYIGKSPFRKDSSDTSFFVKNNENYFKDVVIVDCEGDSVDFVSKFLGVSKELAKKEIREKFS